MDPTGTSTPDAATAPGGGAPAPNLVVAKATVEAATAAGMLVARRDPAVSAETRIGKPNSRGR